MIDWGRDRLVGRHADLRKSVSLRRQTPRKRRLAESQHRLCVVVTGGKFAERRQRPNIGAGFCKIADERQHQVELADRIKHVRGTHDIAPRAIGWRRRKARDLTVTKSSTRELTI